MTASTEVEYQVQFDCGTERLIVSRWTDDPYPSSIYFVMWNMAGHDPGKIMWRFKWRAIWKIIRKGEVYLDQVVIPEPTAHALGQWLVDNTWRS